MFSLWAAPHQGDSCFPEIGLLRGPQPLRYKQCAVILLGKGQGIILKTSIFFLGWVSLISCLAKVSMGIVLGWRGFWGTLTFKNQRYHTWNWQNKTLFLNDYKRVLIGSQVCPPRIKWNWGYYLSNLGQKKKIQQYVFTRILSSLEGTPELAQWLPQFLHANA